MGWGFEQLGLVKMFLPMAGGVTKVIFKALFPPDLVCDSLILLIQEDRLKWSSVKAAK